jgi:hypothetical protein
LRYPDEVTNPSHFAELKDLPEAGEEGLALMTKIADKMTTDLDLRVYSFMESCFLNSICVANSFG